MSLLQKSPIKETIFYDMDAIVVSPIRVFLRILIGSLKLYLSFAGYSLFYRALLQKETCNFKEPTNHSTTCTLKDAWVFFFGFFFRC